MDVMLNNDAIARPMSQRIVQTSFVKVLAVAVAVFIFVKAKLNKMC